MRPHEFLNLIVARFTEMDESELKDLHSDATADYKEKLAEAKAKKISNLERLKEVDAKSRNKDAPEPRKVAVLTVQDKLILKCEHYLTRYGFAIAYILAIPVIRGYMDGGDSAEKDGDADMEFLKLYSAFQKMKKS